jgi:hypothetical protein
MLMWTTRFSCWLILVWPRVLLLAILATNLVTQSGVGQLIYIMMVAICNLRVEYDNPGAKKTYDNVLNEVVKVTNGL